MIKNRDMYERGYANAIQFAYIPDFKNDFDKKDFEQGLKDGYAKNEKLRRLELERIS